MIKLHIYTDNTIEAKLIAQDNGMEYTILHDAEEAYLVPKSEEDVVVFTPRSSLMHDYEDVKDAVRSQNLTVMYAKTGRVLHASGNTGSAGGEFEEALKEGVDSHKDDATTEGTDSAYAETAAEDMEDGEDHETVGMDAGGEGMEGHSEETSEVKPTHIHLKITEKSKAKEKIKSNK